MGGGGASGWRRADLLRARRDRARLPGDGGGGAAGLRAAEPWFPEAFEALRAVWAGSESDDDRDAAMPFFYGRWDETARAHAAVAAFLARAA
ncbi:hypothetical protein [Nonomuraea pusilla]|uniref:Uncharacterized protein n=1 Tax=Nonomuraea pusilla TaxID=46177 RepID=A0A1H8FTW7_9ACTN|nr:hypothetical protein [Nonomuraea pusilla]SEN34984.1 hypothetical protein SAMN05660976_07347 [Nonomuraea pusilla]